MIRAHLYSNRKWIPQQAREQTLLQHAAYCTELIVHKIVGHVPLVRDEGVAAVTEHNTKRYRNKQSRASVSVGPSVGVPTDGSFG